MISVDPRREEAAVAAGRKWAEDKAAALEGTSPRDWPEEWDPAWSGELHLKAQVPKLVPEVVTDAPRARDPRREQPLGRDRRGGASARGQRRPEHGDVGRDTLRHAARPRARGAVRRP